MNPADDLPPTKRPKHFHEVQSAAVEQDPDASTQSLSAAELAEIDRSHRLAASSKILLRMSAKKSVKGRLSDVGANPLVIDRNEGQDENRAQHISKYGETINLEEVNGTGEHSHEHDESGAHEVPCANCHRSDRLERSVKKIDDRISRVEGKIDELNANVRGLRELLLERFPPVAVASSSRNALRIREPREPREPEPAPPPVLRKRRHEEIVEQPTAKEVEQEKALAAPQKVVKSAVRKREERRIRQREKREREREEKRQRERELLVAEGEAEVAQVVKAKNRKVSRKDKSSRSDPPVPVFSLSDTPCFDKYSLSQQILALAEPNTAPSDPEAEHPPLRITIERLPYALFLLISESLPPASRCSLNDLRILWSGASTARKVGEWLDIKMPYLHTAMMSSVVGKPTEIRTGHRNFTMSDPRWPPTSKLATIQVPKLTSSIVAASVGLIRDPTSNTGAFVRDACTICDMQSPDTPLSWRRWLDKGGYNMETMPVMYREPIRNMCGIPFAVFLREAKLKEGKRR